MRNETIAQLLDDGKITQVQYDILFEDKSSWIDNSSTDKLYIFQSALKDVIEKMKKSNKIDLSCVYFQLFDYNDLEQNNDKHEISFTQATFHGVSNFNYAKFQGKADFNGATFQGKAYFGGAIFGSDANFLMSSFEDEVYFYNVTFKGKADFENTSFDKYLNMKNLHFDKINLSGARFDDANFIGLTSDKYKTLQRINFSNKETARVIKAHFDEQKNITESNKYFKLEQELYLQDLKSDNSTEPNRRRTMIALYFNKLVSNFGTDWLRALSFIFMTGYAFMIGYILLGDAGAGWICESEDIKQFGIKYAIYSAFMMVVFGTIYISTWFLERYKQIPVLVFVAFLLGTSYVSVSSGLHTWDFSCYMVQVTNPITAFKDIELYKGIELYAVVVRITIALLIYQLISAFRNNTRRA